MSEPTERQLRKLQRLIAEAEAAIADMLAVLAASKEPRPPAVVVVEPKPLPNAVDVIAWDAYFAHRRAIRAKKLSPHGAELLAIEFAKHPSHVQLAAVDESIRNGWIGFFPAKARNVPADRVETMKRRLQQWIASSSHG